MPSTLHEGLVELFRDDPTLVVRLVQRAFGATLTPMPERLLDRHATMSVASLSRAKQRIADLVLIVRDPEHPDGGAVIVIEVQLQNSRIKRRRIASYLALLIEREHLPIHIGTVALEDRVAENLATWTVGTAVTISTFVLNWRSVPPLIDLAEAHEHPQEAVLSATLHGYRGDLRPVRVALDALANLPVEKRSSYTATILAALSDEDHATCIKELPMDRQVEISHIERRSAFFVHGLEEGTRKGLEEGTRKGLEEGTRKGVARLVLTILELRGLPLSSVQAQLIHLAPLSQLEHWATQARDVESAEDLLGC
ncbi:MAG: hypothetical protein KC457_07400 [Myxococcales bacterium]|nr:hypothetical protein [Myxococcales bacterium]